MSDFQGKVVSILGAAGKDNMGQVIARHFAKAGAKVVVSGRNKASLSDFANEIEGGWTSCEITQRASVDAMIDEVVEKYGKIDVAINATGWGLLKPFEENTDEDLRKITEIQYTGPFYWLQKLVSVMKDTGGSIIQISSATAKIMVDDHAAYMGTKAGLDHVIRCVANEYGAFGIRANSISPGFTPSPMTEQYMQSEALVEEFRKCYPLQRLGTSDDIAFAAMFLASERCFMTGENLQVNGGLCLRRNPTKQEVYEAAVACGEINPE